jgi:hypothetical protein
MDFKYLSHHCHSVWVSLVWMCHGCFLGVPHLVKGYVFVPFLLSGLITLFQYPSSSSSTQGRISIYTQRLSIQITHSGPPDNPAGDLGEILRHRGKNIYLRSHKSQYSPAWS